MRRNALKTDDRRAVSVAITHALTIAITTVLVSGLLIASGGLLDSQEQRVGEDQLEEIAGDVTSHIHAFDRMSQHGNDVTASVEPNYPAQIVGSYAYRIELYEDDGSGIVEVRSSRLGQSVTVEIDTDVAILDSSETGSSPRISLCGDEITLGECP